MSMPGGGTGISFKEVEAMGDHGPGSEWIWRLPEKVNV